VIKLPTKYFLIATLVALAISVPVVVYYQKIVADRHFTINYRIVVKHYILWQFISVWLFFICLNMLIVRVILLQQGFSFTSDKPLEFLIALPLIYSAGCLAHIVVYGLLSTRISEEKYEALFTQTPLPRFNYKLKIDYVIFVFGWVVAFVLIFVNSPG